MEHYIVYVGHLDISKWIPEIIDFALHFGLTVKVAVEDTMDAAYNYIFTHKVYLIIIDSDTKGALEAVKMLKAEEISLYIPLLIFNIEDSMDVKREFLLAGAEQCLFKKELKEEMFFPVLRPMIMHSYFLSEKIETAAKLQEDAITDFIMLDLIKAYIPKTTWKVAMNCSKMQKIVLPEEKRELTIVFGDIKGFTKLSQHLSPQEIISILNETYEVVTRYIYENNGDVDKFIGDAFFGIFPNAKDAIRSMVLIQKELRKTNQRKKLNKFPEIQFRIGIHTGLVIRGNVGGHDRYDNTLIGDAVNTASRLEHIAPVGDIIISETTLKNAGLTIPEKYKKSCLLRGKDSKINVYTAYEYLKDKFA